jgi:hypothetical protein
MVLVLGVLVVIVQQVLDQVLLEVVQFLLRQVHLTQ